MNPKRLLHSLAYLTLLVIPIISSSWATLVTFDDGSGPQPISDISPQYYQGLMWSNLAALYVPNLTDPSGYTYGMVSSPYVAYDQHGGSSQVFSVSGTNFDFLSAYLTGAWQSNLNIEVQGFRAGSMIYDQTVVASATSATLFTFDYLNVDRLRFIPFGGDNAGFGSNGPGFAMDNFNFEFVPEPSAFLLTAAGALMLWSVAKRKRG